MDAGVFKRRGYLTLAIALLCIIAVIIAAVVFLFIYRKNNVDYSYDEILFQSAIGGNVTKYYTDGSGRFSIEGYDPVEIESCYGSSLKKIWYPLEDISPYLKFGFIAAEDRKFYSHSGVDILRTFRATVSYLFHTEGSFGASTITQQVIKNISGDSEHTVSRKLKEILRASHIERLYSKDEILELYLNIVPMSENLAGVGIASEVYFGKEPSSLTLEEAATLVGITNAPTKYNPYLHPDECLKKRNSVLYAMLDFGTISQEEYERAKAEPLSLSARPLPEDEINSWFIETVNDEVIADLQSKCGLSSQAARLLLYSGGLRIYTTEDTFIQNTLEEYFENPNNFPEEIVNGLNYSIVVLDSENANLLGIVGQVGKKRANRLLNYATVPRTPGSALKPLALYAPLIDSGEINWATVFDDVPVSFDSNGNEFPKNYPQIYDGLTTVKDAVRVSKNTVAVNLYNKLGAERIYNKLYNDFSFHSLVRHSYKSDGSIVTDLAPSPLALGQLSFGVSLRRLTEGYTVFPSYGSLSRGRSYIAVYDNKGELLIDNLPSAKQVFGEGCAKVMNKLLCEVTSSGTAKSVKLKGMVETAGKTGTSGDDRDRLFIGYTPYYTAGVWCGYEDGISSVGSHRKNHLTVWDEVMRKIHEYRLSKESKVKKFSTDGLLYLPYCKDSGKMLTELCSLDARGERGEYGYFIPGSIPVGNCKTHIAVEYDTLTSAVAHSGCSSEDVRIVALLDIPWRRFPKEIFITDAEFVWRRISSTDPLGDGYDMPYFIYTIEDGVYVGRSRGKKQFNSACYLHND